MENLNNEETRMEKFKKWCGEFFTDRKAVMVICSCLPVAIISGILIITQKSSTASDLASPQVTAPQTTTTKATPSVSKSYITKQGKTQTKYVTVAPKVTQMRSNLHTITHTPINTLKPTVTNAPIVTPKRVVPKTSTSSSTPAKTSDSPTSAPSSTTTASNTTTPTSSNTAPVSTPPTIPAPTTPNHSLMADDGAAAVDGGENIQ